MKTAQTILEQLGGNQFAIMTGAKNFVSTDNSLMFNLPKNQSKGNKMLITLTAMDDYQVQILKLRGVDVKPIAFKEGLQASDLRPMFSKLTGLDTAL